MAKRETDLQKRVRLMQPLWDRHQVIETNLRVAITEEEKEKWRKELGDLLDEMNKGDWLKGIYSTPELAPAQPATADAGAEIHASELVQLGYELGRYGATTETRAAAVQTYIDTRTADLQAKLAAAEARADAALAFYALMVNIDVLGDIADDLANDETWEVWGELAHLREVLGNGLPANG